jgi:hypothetical protein
MSEKSVVINLEIDAADIKAAKAAMDAAGKSAATYQAEINRLKKQQADLNKQLKDGKIGADDYAKGQVVLNTQMKTARQGLTDANKEFATNQKVVEAARGSNDQLRAQLSILTKQYNSLSKEQRENTNAGRDMQARIKGISDELKSNEKAVGDNRRNVGNYESSLAAVNGKLDTFAAGTKAMPGPLGAMAGGIAGATKAAIAFIATPLGAVLGALALAFAPVVTFLTKTKEGSELLDRAMSMVSATVSVVIDRVAMFGKALNEIRLGNFAKAAELASDAVSGLGEEIQREANQSRELTRNLQELTDAERALTVQRAKSRAEVKALNMIAEDTTKTLKEREEAAQQAIKIERDLMDEQVRLAQRRYEIIRDQNALGESMAEDLDKEAAAEANLALIQAASIRLQTRLQNKLNTIRQQGAAATAKIADERKKMSEAELKAEEALENKRAAVREAFRREQMDEIERRKEDAFNRANELRESGVAEVQIQRFLSDKLVAIHRAEQDAILNDRFRSFEDDAQIARDRVTMEVDSAEARKAAILDINRSLALAKQQELDLEIQKYTASTEMLGIVDEERNIQLLARKSEVDAELVELDRQRSDAIKAHLDEEQREAEEARAAILGTSLSAISAVEAGAKLSVKAITEQAKAAGKTQEEIDKKTAAARAVAKAAAISATIIQTYQAATAAYASASAVPLVGYVLGPIAAAAAAAFGAVQVAGIARQKFQQGGILEGPSHEMGGVPIKLASGGAVEAEGGEIILTKRVAQTPSLLAKASAINVAAGGVSLTPRSGRKFALGGVVSGSPTFAARQAEGGMSINAQEVRDAMTDAMASQPPPIVRVTDINRVTSQSKQVEVSATL